MAADRDATGIGPGASRVFVRAVFRVCVGAELGLGLVTGSLSIAEWFGKLETGLFPSVEINWAVAWLLISTILLSTAVVLLRDNRKIVRLRDMRDEIVRLSRSHDYSSFSQTGKEHRRTELLLRDETSKVIGFLAKRCRINCPTAVQDMSVFFDELYRKIDYRYSIRRIRKFFAQDDR